MENVYWFVGYQKSIWSIRTGSFQLKICPNTLWFVIMNIIPCQWTNCFSRIIPFPLTERFLDFSYGYANMHCTTFSSTHLLAFPVLQSKYDENTRTDNFEILSTLMLFRHKIQFVRKITYGTNSARSALICSSSLIHSILNLN